VGEGKKTGANGMMPASLFLVKHFFPTCQTTLEMSPFLFFFALGVSM